MSEESGENVKGIVVSEPERVVAAWVILLEVRRGSRKVDVQPAPRMRRETGEGAVEEWVGMGGALVLSVIVAVDCSERVVEAGGKGVAVIGKVDED